MKKYTFQEPEHLYRGIDLWMVNDKLEDDEIKKQVYEFKDKGLGTVIFRTYNGLISDYPGDGFKHSVRVAVEAAKERGLKIVLQAGFMPAAIPELPEKYMLHRIFPVKEAALNGDEKVLAHYGGIAYTDAPVPAALNMLDPEAVEYYIEKNYEEMWKDFKDEFGKTIISVWVDEPRFENRYLTWMPDIEELFHKRYGYSIKTNVVSLYHNVGDYKKVRYDYFTFLRDRMEKCYYSKVREWCHKNTLLVSGHLMGEERLHMQTAQAIAVMPFYKYFDIPGFDMLTNNHDWYDKPLKRHNPKDDAEPVRTMNMASVQCVSAAQQAGRKHVLCEMYGVTSPSLGFRDQMHLFDFFASTGVNCQCMHALFYSPRGFRKRFYPQTFNRYQPFWEQFRNVKDYAARVSSFISMGNSTKDILILHPLETAYGLYRGLSDINDEAVRNEAAEYDMKYYKLLTDMYSMQIPFHVGDMATVDSLGSVQDDSFIVGEMSYRVVVLSDIEVLSSRTLELLCSFLKNGGAVLVNGGLPQRVDGSESQEAIKRLSQLDGVTVFENRGHFVRTLAERKKPIVFECNGNASDIMINHRTDGKRNYIMIHNGDCRRHKKGTVMLDGIHEAFRFDAEKNTVTKMLSYTKSCRTIIPAEIAVGGSILIFTEPAEALPPKEKPAEGFRIAPLKNLNCEIEGDNVLTLDLCRYKTEDMAEYSEAKIDIEHTVEILKSMDYTGNVKLEFTFETNFTPRNLNLVMEDPELCTVWLNGQKIACVDNGYYYSKAYRIIKLPDTVKSGVNVIEIEKFYTPQKQAPIRDDMKHLFELFRAPVGVDLERIHITGNFEIKALRERSCGAGIVRLSDKMLMTAKSEQLTDISDVTSHGYPFYPGVVRYTTMFNYDEAMQCSSDILLRIGEYNGCSAEITVNGKKRGSIDREPYTLSVKKHLVCGENKIEIRLFGTFRNMIGPSHINSGDLSGCSRGTWTIPLRQTCTMEPNVISSYMLVPYGIGDVVLEIY